MQGDKYQDNELSSSILRSQHQHQFSSRAPLTSGPFQSDALPFGGNQALLWEKHSDESSTNELCSTQFSIPSVRLSSARLSLTESSLSSSSFLWDFEDQIPLNQIVHPALSMVSGQQYYSMSSRPRGFCLIINNVEFVDHLNYPKRIGSDEEAQRLANVFSQLYFEVSKKRLFIKCH